MEYPVQQFSKKGYIDVAVHIYKNGDSFPYIFAEVKQFGSGIEDAIQQLKSYLEVNTRVRYGIVTDGLAVICMNRAGEILNDLPNCQPQFLPETKNRGMYSNLKNNKKYSIATELDNEEVVEITDMESNMFVSFETKCKIPLIGNVAADVPISVNIDYDSSLTLSKD